MAGDGVDAGAARSILRVCDCLDGVVLTAGGRTGAVWGRDGVTTAGWSAWRVTVPFRLKFWSSLGPIATGFVELDVGAGAGVGVVVLWAKATAGAKAAAKNTAPARKIAFIRSRFLK